MILNTKMSFFFSFAEIKLEMKPPGKLKKKKKERKKRKEINPCSPYIQHNFVNDRSQTEKSKNIVYFFSPILFSKIIFRK